MIKYVNKSYIFGILRVHRVPLCIWFLRTPPVLTLHFVKTRSAPLPSNGLLHSLLSHAKGGEIVKTGSGILSDR